MICIFEKKNMDTIELRREQLSNGQVISNEDLQSEIEQWLSTK